MNEKPSLNPAEALALERFGLITKIQDALSQHIPLAQALQLASALPIRRADGTLRHFSARTCYGFFSGRTFGVIGIAWILGDWPQWHHKC